MAVDLLQQRYTLGFGCGAADSPAMRHTSVAYFGGATHTVNTAKAAKNTPS